MRNKMDIIENERLSDGGTAQIHKMGRRYYFVRTYNSSTIPPVSSRSMKKEEAYKLMADCLQEDILEIV